MLRGVKKFHLDVVTFSHS